MTFGQRLKKLRQKADMTQERLAEYLAVTPQAVSRWENDAVMPDITFLPAFANLFNVTTDYLLGVDITKRDESIKEILDKAWKEHQSFVNKNTHKEMHECFHRAILILEEGLKLYPDSWDLKNTLLSFRMSWFDEDINLVRENQKEMIKICEDILDNNSDNKAMRNEAIEIFCTLAPIFNLNDKAEALAKQMPPMRLSREMLELTIFKGDKLKQLNLCMINTFLNEIACCIFSLTNDPNMNADEVLDLEQRTNKLYSVMYGEDDFSKYFNPYISPYQLAEKLANRGDFDNAFRILNEDHDREILLSENEFKNISPYVYSDSLGMQYAKRTVSGWRKQILFDIDDDHIPFLEKYFPEEFFSDSRYRELLNRFDAYKKKYGNM